jgi:putative flippase GtrA
MTGDARFPAAMAAVTRVLPFGLSRVIPPNVVGYLLINLCTFSMDVLLLSLFHGVIRLPIPAAVTLSYGSAGLVSYAANRIFNFQSRGSVGMQVPLYAAMMISNYFVFVLGLTDLLAWVGVYYLLARVIAACCESVYLYSGMRWLVFRDALGRHREESPQERAECVSPGGGVSGRDSGA